jgi:hypothetical protein
MIEHYFAVSATAAFAILRLWAVSPFGVLKLPSAYLSGAVLGFLTLPIFGVIFFATRFDFFSVFFAGTCLVYPVPCSLLFMSEFRRQHPRSSFTGTGLGGGRPGKAVLPPQCI